MPTTVLRSKPGIKRDGTQFDGDYYTDGQWVRFQRGLPRKIGGYRAINQYITEISRGFNAYTQSQLQYCHTGGPSTLERFTIDNTYSSSVITDRTPVSLLASDDNRWMFANAYDSSTTDNQIFAHVAPNGGCICNDSDGQIFSGSLTGTSVLTDVALPSGANATGGIVMIHPYLFYYGSAGIIGWSVAGEPTDLSSAGSGIARPWGQKIIKGLPLRGSGANSPAGIFWAYDAVVRATFTGGDTVFQFDTIASDTSIMSADCVVDYDGVFYWMGVDRFCLFNGVVRELANDMNVNYFFDGLNQNYRSKVFAFKVPRFGEIWWCYPRGDATECSHAIIYNVREQCWYDTALPLVGRSAGVFNNGFARPLIVDASPGDDGYRLWMHESGVDEINRTDIRAIRSYFVTADLTTLTEGKDKSLIISRIEPDFIQSGELTAQVTGRANARAPTISGKQFVIPETASTPPEQVVMLKEQRRELRVTFESASVGGDYQMGQIIANIDSADGTVLG